MRQEPVPSEFVSVKLTSEESIEFLSLISKLKCIKISFILEADDTSEAAMLPLSLLSTSLNVLRLNTKEPYFFSIVKLSSQIKHLNIDVYSDDQLREIIVAIPNLERLILRLHGCTTHAFGGENEEPSIRRLQKLEFLHITDCEGSITSRVFDEFSFPRLEYLGLCLKNRHNLPESLLNMPAIKTLEVYLFGLNSLAKPKVITELCKFLGNLKHLIVDNLAFTRQLSDRKKLDIFNSLSNLRFITCYKDENIFIFDKFSGKASCSGMCKLQFWEDKFYWKSDRHLDCLKIKWKVMNSVTVFKFNRDLFSA